MATNNNLNVLVEAKKEYIHQLSSTMTPLMTETFQEIYKEAKKISKGKKILLTYQKLLKEVVNWNNHMVKQNSEKISNSCAWFNDLLAAVFVSYVKIFSSVRLNVGTKKISIKLPTNEVFIHGCYINSAKDIYKDPYIFHDEMTDYEREDKLFTRFTHSIENTIKEMVPVKEILNAYISQDRTSSHDLDVSSEIGEDTDDPDIDENPMDELPLGAQPDPEEITEDPFDPPEEALEDTPAEIPIEPHEDETKSIPLPKKSSSLVEQEEEEGVLFPDAPDK